MTTANITVTDGTIVIANLIVTRRDVVDFLAAVPEQDRESLTREALEVGVFCIERARGAQDLEFVRRQVESLLTAVEKAVLTIPHTTEEKLVARLGTGDGQVLAPVQALIEQVERGAQQQLREVRELLASEIDPSKDSSSLGKALKKVGDLLDAGRTDSIQGRMEEAVRTVSAVDGALATSVKATVADCVQPLVEEVKALGLLMTAQTATAAALAGTTAKGLTFEEEVVERIQLWGGTSGIEVTHCGTDNLSGDILVTLSDASLAGAPLTVVVECKDHGTASGRKPIGDAVTNAMATRGASRAIYLARSGAALAREIGEWAEGTTGSGPWVATTSEHLFTALRFSIAMERVERVKASERAVDAELLVAQASRIRDSLKRITNVNRNATDIRSSADAVTREATGLRADIVEALTLMEEVLAVAGTRSQAA